jgi:rod shape-determining protein MreD
MLEYLKYAGVIILLIIVQKTLIWLIAVTSYEITPDIVLIGVVFMGIRKGKISGSVGGFSAGLLMDILSFSFLGLMALSKCVAGFASGFFNNESKVERYVKSYIFVLIVFFCSLLNNLIYFTIYFQGTTVAFPDIVIRYILPTAVYTAFLGIVPVAFMKRKVFVR